MRSEVDEQLSVSLQKASDLHEELQVLVSIQTEYSYFDSVYVARFAHVFPVVDHNLGNYASLLENLVMIASH